MADRERGCSAELKRVSFWKDCKHDLNFDSQPFQTLNSDLIHIDTPYEIPQSTEDITKMRLTRAAIRAQAQDEPDAISIHEDTDADTSKDQITQDEDASRPILKDITEDNYSTTTDEAAELKQSVRGKNSKASKKKGKQTKDEIDQVPAVTQSVADQATDNNEASDPQPALVETEQQVEALETLAPADSPVPNISETEDMTSQTPEKGIAMTSKTPKFDPILHAPEIQPLAGEIQDDSFVDSIKTRSPLKLSREPSRDSFVDSIKSRSPARRTSRLEDSVEAMDALEDAIEEFSIKLPQIEHIEIESPVKTRRSPPKSLPPSARKTALDAKVVAMTPSKQSPTKTRAAQLKQAPPRTTSGRVSTVKPVAKGPTINKSTSRQTTVARKPAPIGVASNTMSFSNSPLKTDASLAKKRMTSGPLSTSKPAFVPAKSAKPPTKSTFILPGEAIAAKMKAQREERARLQEEEKNKKAFKARPAPSKTGRPSVMPRENKSSLARKSSAQIADGQTENKENVSPKGPLKRTSIATAANTRTLDVKKRRPEESASIRANSSVRRTTSSNSPTTATKRPFPSARTSIAPKPTPRPSFAPRVASLTKPIKSSPMAEPQLNTAVKLSGKEVYARTKLGRDKEEKEKREKEEAAKKARAEAAERGRQASREWAEKQKRKVEMQKASNVAATTESPNTAAVESPTVAPTAMEVS